MNSVREGIQVSMFPVYTQVDNFKKFNFEISSVLVKELQPGLPPSHKSNKLVVFKRISSIMMDYCSILCLGFMP